ncbi:MAG: hypothetical protein AAB268_10145 [Elusimicrobiota bacterium]
MKKLLGSTLALAMIMPAGANAEILKNFKMGGQLDIQTTSANNTKDFATRERVVGTANNDRIGHAMTRLILKMDWDLLDDVHSHVALVKGAAVGGAAPTAGTSRTYGSAAEDLNTLQTNITVQEANIKVDKVFGALDMTMGRQFYGEPGDPIIYFGPRGNYGLTVTAIDMFRADWSSEHMNVIGIAGKTADGSIVTDGTTAATDLRGIVVSCKMHEMVKPTLYVYNQVTHAVGGSGTATGKNTNLWIAGLKANIAAGGFSARVELAKNFGEDRTVAGWHKNYSGTAFYGKAGYKLDIENAAVVNPWFEFATGTGDKDGSGAGAANGGSDNKNTEFNAIATSWHPGALYARFHNNSAAQSTSGLPAASGNVTTSQGLTNRVIWGFGVKATPAALNKLTTGVQYYNVSFHRVAPITINGVAGQTPSKRIGSEIDVTADWKHSDNVSLKLTAGSFQPGMYIKNYRKGTANDVISPATLLAADVQVKF